MVLGRSARGRPIKAVRVGSPRARVTLLVFGSVHGDETAGRDIAARLLRSRPPPGTALWVIRGPEPGRRRGRHAPERERGRPQPQLPAPLAAAAGPSTPTTPARGRSRNPRRRARPLRRARSPARDALVPPGARIVVRSEGDPALQRLYSRRSGLPRQRLPRCRGTATGWQNHTFRGDTAFVVELPGRQPLAPRRLPPRCGPRSALAEAVAPQPVWLARSRSGRRAGRDARLRPPPLRHRRLPARRPRVIVEHYTATATFASVFNTFAPTRPTWSSASCPGVCAHYVIDRDGTVYRLVPTSIMCRHTVGPQLDRHRDRARGPSDAQVLGNRRQLRASLRLTRTLQGRHRIATRT